MLTWNESAWFSILASVALKSTVVLGTAWLIAFLLRRRSAAARHLVWTAATAAVLAMPVLSIAMPDLKLPAVARILPSDTGLVFRSLGVATEDRSSQPTVAATVPGGPVAPGPRRPNLRLWLMGIWAAGVAASLIQMLVAYVSLWRVRRSASPVEDEGLSFALAHALEIPHPVPVLETTPGSMPMTFGFLRPSIFLPADSAQWSVERRRIVLLHELAHVRRGDAATHLIARTALGLNWFNPMAWIAWREFLKERERAADDLVLNSGARASDYATHLLEVAVSRQSAPVIAAAAVAMARRSQLEGRLLAILDSRVNRKAARTTAPVLAALAAAVLVAPFAAVRAQDPAIPQAPPEIDATIRVANSEKNHEILEHAAKLYENQHQYDVAQKLLENALAIRGQVSGQQSAAYAAGLVKLGELYTQRNQHTEALTFYRKAVALGDRPEVAPALVYLGIEAIGKRDYVQAMDLLQRAVNVDPSGPQAGPALTWMASAKEAQSDPQLQRFEAAGPAPAAGSRLPNFQTTTRYDPATGAYPPPQKLPPAEVEGMYQRALAAEDPNSLHAATTMELYARFLRQNNRDAEAAPLVARAQEIRRQSRAALPPIQQPGMESSASVNAVKMVAGMQAPVVVSKTDPAYSEEARAAKYQGTVLLGIEVGIDGFAHNVIVVRGLGLGLDEKAIEAIQQWHFRPGMKDGQPVPVKATIEVNFRLQ